MKTQGLLVNLTVRFRPIIEDSDNRPHYHNNYQNWLFPIQQPDEPFRRVYPSVVLVVDDE